MDVIEKDDEITLRDVPFTNWIHGVLFLLGFVLFGTPVVLATVKTSQLPDVFLIISFILAIFALYWSIQKLLSPVIITRVNLPEQIVHIKRLKFPFAAESEIYQFARIRHFESVARKPDRAYLYFNVMILKDDSYIDLESSGTGIQTNRISSKLNELLKQHQKSRRKR